MQIRAIGIYTNNNLSTHFYNDGGERVLKNVLERIDISENDQQTVGEYISKGTIFYPSGIFVYSPKYYTKHYYMGSKRIASRIGRPSEQNYFTFDDSEYTDILNQIKNTQTQLLQPIYEVTNITEPNTDSSEEDLADDIYNIASSFDDLSDEAIRELFAQSLAMLDHNPNIQYGSLEWFYCSKFLSHAYHGDSYGVPYNDFNGGTRHGQYYNTIKELVLDAEAFQLECLIKPTSKTNTWWYHTDHLGSTSYITDSNGVVSHYYNYLPFGELFNEQRFSLYDNVYKFNAKELDDASGLYYYSARYYDPKLSIFLSVDPLAEETFEPYSYTGNNPIMFTDPTGMSKDDIVTYNMDGKEISREKSDKVFKTYIQKDNGQVVEAPMPNVIPDKEGSDTSGPIYQKYDYIIAAETAIFNINKNERITPSHSNGKYIDDPCSVPDLNPTLVKATIMQETTMGTYDRNPNDRNDSKSDIMQANVYYNSKSHDWGDHKLQFGLKEEGGAKPQQSIRAGIGLMYQKGLLTKNGKTTWIGGKTWNKASERYNGGGEANYGNVLKMRNNSIKPKRSNY